MAHNLVVLYRPGAEPESPLVWFAMGDSPGDTDYRRAAEGALVDFHQSLLDISASFSNGSGINLHLFLADELVSFHQVDVPEGVRRNLQALLPVLLEEQLAQDIEQVAVHYAGAAADTSEESRVNTAVWQRQALEQLITALKRQTGHQTSVRIKSCLPVSVWPALNPLTTMPEMPEFRQWIPRVPEADQLLSQATDSSETLALQLEHHRWNLVAPEQSERSPLYRVTAVGLFAAGLYLLNQWLSVA